MTTAMYDAREAIIPGSVYDRSSQGESALRGSALALWVLIVPTPAAFGPVTPGVTSQASVHRNCLTEHLLTFSCLKSKTWSLSVSTYVVVFVFCFCFLTIRALLVEVCKQIL